MRIYQAFFKPSQVASLDKEFIPYNNLKNEEPLLHEYPLLLDLYDKNQGYDGYWGMVSAKFKEKTGIDGQTAKNLINHNPGYDVYHYNPFPKQAQAYINPFVQADHYYHPGMVDYVNKLLIELGYDLDIKYIKIDADHFMYCSYYVGNFKFWSRWIPFLQTCIFVSNKEPDLKNYLYGYTSKHGDSENFFNFPFVVERLVSLFVHLNSDIKVKQFVVTNYA